MGRRALASLVLATLGAPVACAQIAGLDLSGYSQGSPRTTVGDDGGGDAGGAAGGGGDGGASGADANEGAAGAGGAGAAGAGGAGGVDAGEDVDASDDGDASEEAPGTDATTQDSTVGKDDADADSADEDASTTDAGPSCANACGPRSVCLGGTCTPARRVFLTSSDTGVLMGAFGGASGGDQLCGDAAAARSLGGAWMAWVSESSSVAPVDRFTPATVPYVLLDGTIVANDWAGLTSGAILHSIDLDENGVKASDTGTDYVWTGSDPTGVGTPAYTCDGWTNSVGTTFGTFGRWTRVDSGWSNAGHIGCNIPFRLYCFEQ